MSDITELIEKLKEFRDARDWEQFHNAKDLAIAISAEAGELLEFPASVGAVSSSLRRCCLSFASPHQPLVRAAVWSS